MRIGIITCHRAFNCGAMLQAWATKTILSRMGHEASFPACNNVGYTKRWEVPWWPKGLSGIKFITSLIFRVSYNVMSIGAEDCAQYRYNKFRRKCLPEKDVLPKDFQEVYDALVFGSDQIWHEKLLSEDEQALFFGESMSRSLPKIAYAASSGDVPQNDRIARRIGATADSFCAVSVREELLKNEIARYSKKEVKIVCDPTLLLTKDDYAPIESRSYPSGDYVFVYALWPVDYVLHMAKIVAARTGLKVIIAPVYQHSRYDAPRGMTYGMSPDRLLSYIAHAKYVLSYSFHGVVFSIQYRKPFLDLCRFGDGRQTRSLALLKKLGMEKRHANPSVPDDVALKGLFSSFPSELDEKLKVYREESLAWLLDAIGKAEHLVGT